MKPETSANTAVPSAVQHATFGVVDQVLLENAGQIRNRAFGVGFRHGQLRFVFRVRRVRTCYIAVHATTISRWSGTLSRKLRRSEASLIVAARACSSA